MVLASLSLDMGRPGASFASGLSGAAAGRCQAGRRRPDDLLKKSGKIVGQMVDMRLVAPFQLPVLAEDLALALRHHQHRGHAERMRRFQIARQVLEHGGLGRHRRRGRARKRS